MQRTMIVTNSLSGGGAERSMNLLSNQLTKRGWQVSLVPINSSAPDLVEVVSEVLPLERKWNGSFMNTLIAFWKFNKVVRVWKPDVIVLNCDLPELFGAILLRKQNLVAIEHSSQPWGHRKPLGKVVRRILKLRKTIWVAVSSHLSIWPTSEKPISILQNSVLLSKENKIQVREGEIKRLIFIGRLSPEKRPDLAVQIAKITKLELVIVGDGIMREDLEKKVGDESIRVTFLGWVKNPWSKIQLGDLLLVTSSLEGDGLVVIEGLAHGMPMLVSDISDLRRFNFPERNYGKDLNGFVTQCVNYQQKLSSLCVPEEISKRILKARKIETVSTAWENFLKK